MLIYIYTLEVTWQHDKEPTWLCNEIKHPLDKDFPECRLQIRSSTVSFKHKNKTLAGPLHLDLSKCCMTSAKNGFETLLQNNLTKLWNKMRTFRLKATKAHWRMQARIQGIEQTFKGRLDEARVNISGQNVKNLRITKSDNTNGIFTVIRLLTKKFSMWTSIIKDHNARVLTDGDDIKFTWRDWQNNIPHWSCFQNRMIEKRVRSWNHQHCERKWCIMKMKPGKAIGIGNTAAELLKIIGNHNLQSCMDEWKLACWVDKGNLSAFTRKGDVTECSIITHWLHISDQHSPVEVSEA